MLQGLWTSMTGSKKVELIEDGKMKPVVDRTYFS